jgi:hypothetical protein
MSPENRVLFCRQTSLHFGSYLAQFFLERKMFQIEVIEKTETDIVCSKNFVFSFENRNVYEIMWENIVEPGIPHARTRIACWIPKARSTNSDYVILIAFPLQQW